MHTWRKTLALAGIALVAGACGTPDPTLPPPASPRADLAPGPEGAHAPLQLPPPPADTGGDGRWGGFIGGGG